MDVQNKVVQVILPDGAMFSIGATPFGGEQPVLPHSLSGMLTIIDGLSSVHVLTFKKVKQRKATFAFGVDSGQIISCFVRWIRNANFNIILGRGE